MGIQAKGHGAYDGTIMSNVNNLHVLNSTVYQSGGPGMQFSRCTNSDMKYCHITESGNRNDNRKWGRGSGMWTWGCYNFFLEHNIFEGAQGIGDSCGAHIDFNCTNVVIQYCLSKYNCGGFIEVLGLNNNCCYRYNVSINDGWKDSQDFPAQAFWGNIGGKSPIVTINGHNSGPSYIGPYNTYIYNNTIINTIDGNKPYNNPFKFGIATSNRGLLVMNNIFWFAKKCGVAATFHGWKDGAACDKACDFCVSTGPKSNAKANKGVYPAQSRPMNENELAIMNLIMKNNLYELYNPKGTDKYSKVENALPNGYWDENALGGNPEFKNVDGSEAEDMIPSNAKIIMKGMEVKKLSTDKTKYGIYYGGLKVKKDFFGHKIKGNILGAIMPINQK